MFVIYGRHYFVHLISKYTQILQALASVWPGLLPGQAPPKGNSPLGRAALHSTLGTHVSCLWGGNLGFITSPLCFMAGEHSPFRVLRYSLCESALTDTSVVDTKKKGNFIPGIANVCVYTQAMETRVVLSSSNYHGL